MAVQDVSLSAMFGWISEAMRMLRAGRGRLAAASLWMILAIVVVLLPFFAILFASGAMTATPGVPFQPTPVFWVAYALMILLSFVLQPPLVIGWFRLCGDVDAGRPGSGSDIFAPFRDLSVWGRSLQLMLLTLVLVGVAFAVTLLPFLPGFLAFQKAMEAHQALVAAGVDAATPTPPFGFFLGYFAFLLLAVLLQIVSLVAMGEVASRPTSPLAALSQAAKAVVRHLFKLLLFFFVVWTLVGLVLMVVIIPLVIISLVLAYVSPALAVAVVALMYVALLMVIYPVMFVFQYLMWKGLLGGEATPAADAPASTMAV